MSQARHCQGRKGGGTVAMLPHATEVEGARAAQRAAMVGRPHRGGQPKLDAVGHGNGLSLVGEGLHGDHRPEDLGASCYRRVHVLM